MGESDARFLVESLEEVVRLGMLRCLIKTLEDEVSKDMFRFLVESWKIRSDYWPESRFPRSPWILPPLP